MATTAVVGSGIKSILSTRVVGREEIEIPSRATQVVLAPTVRRRTRTVQTASESLSGEAARRPIASTPTRVNQQLTPLRLDIF
jgi:hypothetical protein